MKKLIILIFFLTALTGKVFSQIAATLAGYPLVTTGWNIGGFGAVVDSEVRLTTAGTNENGYVYYNTVVNLTACAQFTVKFDYRIVPAGGAGVADGIAFFYISTPPSGFITGGGLGLPNPLTGMVFTLDTWDNDGDGLNPESQIFGYTTSSTYSEANRSQMIGPINPNLAYMDDGTWHHCEIDYNAGNIFVYYDYNATPGMTGYYLITIPSGYFGFSASTGAGYSTQSVKNIHITAVGVAAPPTVVSPVHYCQDAAATPLSATGSPGSPLHWFSTDTATTISLPGTPTPSTAVPGITWYYVRQGDKPCMSISDSVEVIVSAPPGPPMVTGHTPYCQGDAPIPFTITAASGATVYWYPSAAGGTGSTTAPTVNTAVAGTYTYYYGQTIAPCMSPIDSIKIVVNPLPAPITGAGGVCRYFTTALSDVATGGTWASGSPAIATVTASGIVSGIAAGTATITYQLPTGCYITTTVNVHPKPTIPAVAPVTYCQFNTPNVLTATGTAGDILLWYGAGVSAPGSTTAPVPLTSTPGVTDYYVTQTSTFGCVSDSAIEPVTIIAQPAPPVATNNSYCQYSPTVPLNYQVDSAAGSSLSWYAAATGGAPLGGMPAVNNTVVTYPAGTTWYVSQTVDGCPSNRAPVNVTIVYKPDFTIIASTNWVCDHDTLSFSYSGSAPLLDSSYQWQLPLGATIVSGKVTDSIISVRFDTTYGEHFVSLTVGELGNMCSATEMVPISVIQLPSATTYMNPNICLGDTVNLALSNESATASIFSWYIDGTPLENSTAINIVAANSNSGGPYSLSWNDTGTHIITVACTTIQGCRSAPTYDTVDVHALPDATFTFKPKSTGALCLEDSVQFMANYVNYNCSYIWAPAHGFNNDNKPVIWGKIEESQDNIVLTVTDPFGCVGRYIQQIDASSCCAVLFPNAFTPNGDGRNDLFRPIFNGYHKFHSFRIVNRWGQTVFESADSNPMWDGNFNGVPQDIGTYYYFIEYDCGGNTIEAKGDCTLIR